MSCRNKRLFAGSLAAALLIFCVGCAGDSEETVDSTPVEGASTVETVSASDMFTDRDKEIGYDESTAIAVTLEGDSISCGSKLVTVSGSTATVTGEGTYLLSGSLSNGQIVVDADPEDKIQLVLDGVSINCDTSAAIYVKQADKVFITLSNGSENTLSNTSEFVDIDENSIDAVIFSKDDLTLNGRGTLTVQAVYGHGIVSKDDLVVTSGTYVVTAEKQALSGKDSVRIAEGSFTLTSGKDGIHGENNDDTTLGQVYISGGDFVIHSGGDGIAASNTLQIEGGTFQIQAGGGSENAAARQEDFGFWGQGAAETTDTASTKGIKAGGNLAVNGGTFTIDSADDGIHSNADVLVQAGEITVSTGDDGIHADGNLTVSGGTITVLESYEGLEGLCVDITDGTVSVVSSDDGLNAGGGADQSGFGWMRQDTFSQNSDCYIRISGGRIYVNAEGDGVDSNGNLYVSGGGLYISGPVNGADGAIDYEGTAEISGGTVIAVGASGMAMNFGSTSTQGSALVNVTQCQAGEEVVLKDREGNVLASYTPEKSYNSVVVSCPGLQAGETYTLVAGDNETSIEMTSLIYGAGGGMAGGFGGMGGKGGFPGGKDGEMGTPPDGIDGGMETPPDGISGEMGTPPDGIGGGMETPPDGIGGGMETPPDGMEGEMEGPQDGMGSGMEGRQPGGPGEMPGGET